jgi:hypothetical protein
MSLRLSEAKALTFVTSNIFQAISTFLDQQAMLFVDTADMFAKMARETLVHGRYDDCTVFPTGFLGLVTLVFVFSCSRSLCR